jgi:hypothetical protein
VPVAVTVPIRYFPLSLAANTYVEDVVADPALWQAEDPGILSYKGLLVDAVQTYHL